ncbi:hypothetical protein [Virgibacillus ihumii]|uniref:hypothetical protein n=1 Tax=Virgibacillus ihumii TaxID=2686091 RepID=UPI00157DEAEE|nr:hypothetical protein [Virgibacillus ihumii]
MNPVILYKKISHEFENKLNRDLTEEEDNLLKWIANQKFTEEDNRRSKRQPYQY